MRMPDNEPMDDKDAHERDPAQPCTIELQHPITWGKKEIAEIVLRPVTGADLRKLKTPTDRPLAMVLELAGYLSGQPYQIIDRLQGEDLGRVMDETNFFFASSQETGKKPSPPSE